jgi:hypothetical protein
MDHCLWRSSSQPFREFAGHSTADDIDIVRNAESCRKCRSLIRSPVSGITDTCRSIQDTMAIPAGLAWKSIARFQGLYVDERVAEIVKVGYHRDC